MTMGQYELQSYFKSLCNSFYIAYRQEKRIEKEGKEKWPIWEKELARIDALLERNTEEKIQNKDTETRKELKMQKAEIVTMQEEYQKQRSQWKDRKNKISPIIERTAREIADQNQCIIITSEAEIYALILLYTDIPAGICAIINLEEAYQELFPTGKVIYQEFLEAYKNDILTIWSYETKMPELYNRYF